MDCCCQAPIRGAADQRHVRGGSMGADCDRMSRVHRNSHRMHWSAAGQSILYPCGEVPGLMLTV